MTTYFRIAAPLLIMGVLFLGVGCIRFASKAADGGMFVSEDRGGSWEQRVFVEQQKNRAITIADEDITTVAFHPSEADTVFVGLAGGRVYRTTDAGKQWSQFLQVAEPVTAFALNEKNPKNMVVVFGQRLARTLDGGGAWETIFVESRPGISIRDVLVDQYDPKRLYLVFSDGRVTHSVDAGISWAPFFAVPSGDPIARVLIHPKDTRVITVVTERDWLYRTEDLGVTWVHLKDTLRDYNGAHRPQAVVLDPNDRDTVLYFSEFGLLRTRDGGKIWTPIETLHDPRAASVTAATINPKKANEWYYTTAATLYQTVDAGKRWSTRSLPTSRQPVFFRIEPKNTDRFFLGVKKVKK